MMKKPTVLMILDGFGLNDRCDGNAICQGKTPIIDDIMKKYPFVKGYASGMDVGLPEGQMGNSEVGHLNIGAGRIVYQELTRITKSIQDGDFFKNPELLAAVNNCKENNSSLHLFGLVSDGGVHSHNSHIYALLELAKREGLSKVYGVGKIATVMGRYYAMDRDNRWERVKLAYDAMVLGEGNRCADPVEAVQLSYDNEIYDEFVVPTVITASDEPVATIQARDSIICFNFRPDRVRQITRAFCDEDFAGFERAKGFLPLKYVCFTEYDITIKNKEVAFKPTSLTKTLGEYWPKRIKTIASG